MNDFNEDDNETFSSYGTNSSASSTSMDQIENSIYDDSRRNPSKISGMYNGTGTSCHHCKSRKESDELFFCSNLFSKKTSNDTKRKCHKKYCISCMNKFYHAEYSDGEMGQAGDLGSEWTCPCCKSCCRCTACLKSNSKKSVMSDVSTSLIKNELKSLKAESIVHHKNEKNLPQSISTPKAKDISQELIAHYKEDDIGAMNRSSIHLLNAMLELQAQKEKKKAVIKRNDLVPNFENKVPSLPVKKLPYIPSPMVSISNPANVASPIVYHLNQQMSLDSMNHSNDVKDSNSLI